MAKKKLKKGPHPRKGIGSYNTWVGQQEYVSFDKIRKVQKERGTKVKNGKKEKN